MTVLYIVLIVFQIGVIIYFVRRGSIQRRNELAHGTGTNSSSATDSTTYDGLRSIALQVTPAQLGFVIPENETFVYGVIMDYNIGDGIVTVSAYITGAISIYFSNGGVKTGGGMTPEVAELAVDFVAAAQGYIDRTIRVTDTELPSNGCVRFYLLTNHGIYVAQEQLAYFENGSSAWLPLFEKGNEVIAQTHNGSHGNLIDTYCNY